MSQGSSRIGDPEREHARLVLDEAHRARYIDDNEYLHRRDLLDAAVWEADLVDVVGDLDRVRDALAAQQQPQQYAYAQPPPQVLDHRMHVSQQRSVSYRIRDVAGAVWALFGLAVLGFLIWMCVAVMNDM